MIRRSRRRWNASLSAGVGNKGKHVTLVTKVSSPWLSMVRPLCSKKLRSKWRSRKFPFAQGANWNGQNALTARWGILRSLRRALFVNSRKLKKSLMNQIQELGVQSLVSWTNYTCQINMVIKGPNTDYSSLVSESSPAGPATYSFCQETQRLLTPQRRLRIRVLVRRQSQRRSLPLTVAWFKI